MTEVIEPATAADVAAALRHASEERQSVVIRGAGTKSDWGRTAGHIDVLLDMRRLNRVLAHQHGDLTAVIEAGATLHDVNHALARHGQWLPLDPPFAEHATIGGILATNDSGPLRHRYGTPRDLVIGIQLATTDGVISKAGGQVVKNVAGYDLSKLVAGSFGSLAAFVSATFKLTPLPAASKTLTLDVPDVASLAQVVRTVMASQIEPIAFEVAATNTTTEAGRPFRTDVGRPSRTEVGRPFRGAVILRFASLPNVVDAQIDQAKALAPLQKCPATIVDGDRERALWRAHATRLPADIAGALNELGRIAEPAMAMEHAPSDRTEREPSDQMEREPFGRAAAAGLKASPSIEVIGRAGVGAGLIRIDADEPAQARIIGQLRETAAFGNVVIVRGSAVLKTLVDVWGPQGDRQSLFGSLKQAFDPNGVLNAGRGPL